jgi:hypothetical protein
VVVARGHRERTGTPLDLVKILSKYYACREQVPDADRDPVTRRATRAPAAPSRRPPPRSATNRGSRSHNTTHGGGRELHLSGSGAVSGVVRPRARAPGRADDQHRGHAGALASRLPPPCRAAMDESAGKRRSTRVRKGCAGARDHPPYPVPPSQGPPGGTKKAILAVAASMLTAVYAPQQPPVSRFRRRSLRPSRQAADREPPDRRRRFALMCATLTASRRRAGRCRRRTRPG